MSYTKSAAQRQQEAAAAEAARQEKERKRNALKAERDYLEDCQTTLSDLESKLKTMQKEATARPDAEGEWEGSYFDFYENWMKNTLQSPYDRYINTVSEALSSVKSRISSVKNELFWLW